MSAQTRIFEKFVQYDASTTRDYGGSGLGLSISKRLAELMGGDITVDSHAGEGAVFTLSLPVKRNTKDIFIQSEPPSLRNVRLLIVDDLPIVRELVHEQATLAGMRVDKAANGKEALLMIKRAAAQGDPYKIALVDYLMPQMNGEVLARAISDLPDIGDICLIMMTAAGNPVIGEDVARKGFSAYISKPVRRDMLIDMLSYVWTQYKAGKKDVLIRVDTLTFGKETSVEDTLMLKGPRILLAEDSRINQAFAQEVLESMGCHLIVASNGREAISELENNPDIALVLMDCQMPIMDGFEASRAIAEMKKTGAISQKLPIIALTANAMEGDRERCIAAGMDDYLSKPVRRKELKKAVYRWIVDLEGHKKGQGKIPLLDDKKNNEARHDFGSKYLQMVEYYREDIKKYINEIASAIQKKQLVSIVRPVHTIKSNSHLFGLSRMADIATMMEIKALAMSEGRMQKSFKDLAHELSIMESCFEASHPLLKEQKKPAARQA